MDHSSRRDRRAELKTTLALFEEVGAQCLGAEAYRELATSNLFNSHLLGALGRLSLMANSVEEDMAFFQEDFHRNVSKVLEAYWRFEGAFQAGEPSGLSYYGLAGLAEGKLQQHLSGLLAHLELLAASSPSDRFLPMGFKVAKGLATAAAKLTEAACATLGPLRDAETWQEGLLGLLLEGLQEPLREHMEDLERQRLLGNYIKLVAAAREAQARWEPYEGQEPLPGLALVPSLPKPAEAPTPWSLMSFYSPCRLAADLPRSPLAS